MFADPCNTEQGEDADRCAWCYQEISKGKSILASLTWYTVLNTGRLRVKLRLRVGYCEVYRQATWWHDSQSILINIENADLAPLRLLAAKDRSQTTHARAASV